MRIRLHKVRRRIRLVYAAIEVAAILAAFGIPLGIAIADRRQDDLNRRVILAAKAQYIDAAKELLDQGADVNAEESIEKPLALSAGLWNIVKPRKPTYSGKSPTCLLLMMQSYRFDGKQWLTGPPVYPDLKLLSLLLNHHAILGPQGPFDESPLLIACQEDWPGAARILIENGADVNARADGATPLLLTTFHDNLEISILLLKHGAQPNVRSAAEDRTPLNYAIVDSSTLLAKALIQYGADVNFKTYDIGYPQTPLAYALDKGWCPDIVKLLRIAGAKP
jgi:ankyrin repeat protein